MTAASDSNHTEHGYNPTAFLMSSIKDMQDTIRAIDFKANALLVTLAVLLGAFDKVVQFSRALLGVTQGALHNISAVSIILMAVGLLFSFWLALLTLCGNYNAPNHVEVVEAKANNAFFIGGNYDFNLRGLFWHGHPHHKSKEKPRVAKQEACLPNSVRAETTVLVYEQLKLAYIRDLKVKRVNTAIYCAGFALLFFALAYSLAYQNGAI